MIIFAIKPLKRGAAFKASITACSLITEATHQPHAPFIVPFILLEEALSAGYPSLRNHLFDLKVKDSMRGIGGGTSAPNLYLTVVGVRVAELRERADRSDVFLDDGAFGVEALAASKPMSRPSAA